MAKASKAAKVKKKFEKDRAKRRAVETAVEFAQPELTPLVEVAESRKRKKEEKKLAKLRRKEKKRKEHMAESRTPFFSRAVDSERSKDNILWLVVLFVIFEGISHHTFFTGFSGAAMFVTRFFIYGFIALILFFTIFYDPEDLAQSYRRFGFILVILGIAFAWPYLFSWLLNMDLLTKAIYNILVSVCHPLLIYIFFIHHVIFPRSPFAKYFIFAVFFLFIVFSLTTVNAIRVGSFDIPWLTPSIEKTNFLGAWYSVWKTVTQPIIDLVKSAYYLIFGKLLGIAPMPGEDEDGLPPEKKGIRGFIEKQIAFATGRVEKGAKKKLGVFLDEVKQTGPLFYEGSPVDIYSTITAETLDQKSVNIELVCKIKNETNTFKPRDEDYIPSKSIKLLDKDLRNIECVFEDIPAGEYTAIMEAKFDFETVSYLKSYFIDDDTFRSLRMADVDFFKHYNIKDKSPVAQSTAGPVLVGVGVDRQPLAVEFKTVGQRIPLAIKLTNNWDGQISLLKDFVVAVPKGLVMTDFFGLKGRIPPTQIECSDLLSSEQEFCDDAVYNLYQINAGQKNIKDDVRYGAVLEVSDPSVLLGQAPPSTNYFKVNAHYTYSLAKEKSIEVTKIPE